MHLDAPHGEELTRCHKDERPKRYFAHDARLVRPLGGVINYGIYYKLCGHICYNTGLVYNSSNVTPTCWWGHTKTLVKLVFNLFVNHFTYFRLFSQLYGRWPKKAPSTCFLQSSTWLSGPMWKKQREKWQRLQLRYLIDKRAYSECPINWLTGKCPAFFTFQLERLSERRNLKGSL